jgi:hypothetical protein
MGLRISQQPRLKIAVDPRESALVAGARPDQPLATPDSPLWTAYSRIPRALRRAGKDLLLCAAGATRNVVAISGLRERERHERDVEAAVPASRSCLGRRHCARPRGVVVGCDRSSWGWRGGVALPPPCAAFHFGAVHPDRRARPHRPRWRVVLERADVQPDASGADLRRLARHPGGRVARTI